MGEISLKIHKLNKYIRYFVLCLYKKKIPPSFWKMWGIPGKKWGKKPIPRSRSDSAVLRRLRQARQPIRPRRPYVGQSLQNVIGLPVCSGHNGISVGGDSSRLGFYSLMSQGLTLVIMTVEFEFLEEEGNVLLIIVSLRGTDLEVGVLWYGVASWAEGKQISLLCKAISMLKVTLTRFCSLKLFLSFKGMGLEY